MPFFGMSQFDFLRIYQGSPFPVTKTLNFSFLSLEPLPHEP